MQSLQSLLELKELPLTIECFDISTLQGREAVGSMVVFRQGEADKSSYRRYKIRGVEGQDDLAMMREVLRRRYSRIAETPPDEATGPPELLLVDGGRGQLGVALEVLSDLEITACDVAALAKARSGQGRRLKGERVFLPGRREALDVPEDSYAFRLLTRVRDEAHRFAVDYHRRLRRRSTMESPLTGIPGIGKVKARRLLEHFGGLNKVARASVAELKQVSGVSDAIARAVRKHFAQDAKEGP
jgi:excinuclease ABC subunit C